MSLMFHLLFSHTCLRLAPETPVTILFQVLPSLCSHLIGCPLKPSIGCGTRCFRTLYSSRRFCKKCAVISNLSDFTLYGVCSTVKVTERMIIIGTLDGGIQNEGYSFPSIACAATSSQGYHPCRVDQRYGTHHMHDGIATVPLVQE